DGSGGGGSVRSLETMGRTYVPRNPGWEWVVANMGTVPVVSLALGSVAGLGAARVVTSHLAVMVKGTAQVFVAGPPVVARLGEQVDKEALGGSHIHARNGVVDLEVECEDDAFAAARLFLSYLPSSAWPGSTAGRAPAWPATRTTTARGGPPTRPPRGPASSTWPTRSTSRSCTWWTSPASSSGPMPSGPGRSGPAPGRWPPSTR